MRQHYERILKDTDARVEKSLRIQNTDEASPYCGAFPDGNDLLDAKYTIYRITSMTAAYSNQESRYHHDGRVAQRILLGLDFVARSQHEDGLFDLIKCNFHSAPDTAFIIKRMLPVLHYLEGTERDACQEQIYQKFYSIAKKAAFGLLEGGFHTPNHRWAIASNLMECAAFFHEPRLAEAAGQYLAEGIDCNDDGEYAEKSAGNYNRINNDAMITLGRCTGDETYFEHAVRNLRMMLTYIEPDGTIFTANSVRQDNGKRIYPKDYYWEYLTMGKDRDIPEFLSFAGCIFELIDENHLTSPDILMHFMNRPEMIDFTWKDSDEPGDCRCFYKESGIVRIRRGRTVCTLMKGKSNFLHFSNRAMDVMLKIGGCVCEHRAFIPDSLEETADGFVLRQVMKGWYYLPFQEPPATNDWWQMDHSLRGRKLGPDLTIEVRVRELADGVEVSMGLHGIERAPFRVEAAVLGARKADTDAFCTYDLTGKRMVVKKGQILLTGEEEALEIGPGFGTHAFIDGQFGSESSDARCFTMYFTDYTEFDHTITIRDIAAANP